ncbi:hypothetical protein CVT26_001351 [Gymnopilus dilepis]|uniref:Uncharacterized protein n=1 Tax=Gymnopilus dilepis TaxID=231916 RepID=A0A409WBG3_9AGAR|nr:hypothetical protein CVT26_001351 [Gymnopilus dilepis]
MQGFHNFLWPPEPQATLQIVQHTNGSDSELDDQRQVEHLINPSDFDMHSSLPDQSSTTTPRQGPTLNPPPAITINDNPLPTMSSMPGHYQQRERTPSPASVRSRGNSRSPLGSKRSSPQPSPERGRRGDYAQSESASSKIRLVSVSDPQQATLMEELKLHLLNSNKVLESLKQEIAGLKESTAAAREKAENAEKVALEAEKVLQADRLQAEQRLRKIHDDVRTETAKQIDEAERRAEVRLKTTKNMEQGVRPQQLNATPVDEMIVDQGASQDGQPPSNDKGKNLGVENIFIPMEQLLTAQKSAPPRFPEPAREANQSLSSPSVPKPLTFKRPKSSGRPMTADPLNNCNDGDDEGSDISSVSDDDQEAPQLISSLNGEEMLKLLLNKIGLDARSVDPVNKSERRRANRDFKAPAKKSVKQRGKQNLMNWLRRHLHILLDIKKSRDILNFASEIYSSDSPLQRHMNQWEKTKEGEAPILKPMKINWNNFDGPWNVHLCELFVRHCVTQGLESGNSSEEMQEFVAAYFWDRLERLRTIVKKGRPKVNETLEQTSTRRGEQHLQALSIARRNSRRNQKHHERIDICLENLPENIERITGDAQRDWKTKYDVVMALGPEGMSSDETDGSDPDTYRVRTLPWRNKSLVQTMVSIDDAKNITNGYGNIRPGNRPRIRQRKKNATTSARRAPTGKPKDLYEPDWYKALTVTKKRTLKAKSALDWE